MTPTTEARHTRVRTVSLAILAFIALVSSRSLFYLFHDPEGPNLLIVCVVAGALFSISATVYLFNPLTKAVAARLSAAVILQVVTVIVLYFCLK